MYIGIEWNMILSICIIQTDIHRPDSALSADLAMHTMHELRLDHPIKASDNNLQLCCEFFTNTYAPSLLARKKNEGICIFLNANLIKTANLNAKKNTICAHISTKTQLSGFDPTGMRPMALLSAFSRMRVRRVLSKTTTASPEGGQPPETAVGFLREMTEGFSQGLGPIKFE